VTVLAGGWDITTGNALADVWEWNPTTGSPSDGTFSRNFSAAVSENPCMTLPRQVVPGHDYMIARRCSERRFFLRSDEETNNAFIYCLVLAAKRAKVDITFCVWIGRSSAIFPSPNAITHNAR
jgi:hypothetical protein